MRGRGGVLVVMVAMGVLAAGIGVPRATAQPATERLAGSDRSATAAAVSAARFDPGVEVAYVATGENFPDALAGGPLAGTRRAPILLVGRDTLPPSTAAELTRLAPASIRILGGAPAVSDAVVAQLAGLTAGDVQRIEGPNRFGTAAAVAVGGFEAGVADVFVATGANFPDALAGGAAGAVAGIPVLLTNGDSIPQETQAALEALQPGRITVLGSDPVVTDAVVAELAGLTAGTVRRLAGPNRFATAAAIAADTFPGGAPVVYLATGGNFPDALAGAPAAGSEGGPLLLVNTECAPAETIAAIGSLGPSRVVVLGGESVVSPAAAALTPCGMGAVPLPTFEVDPSLQPDTAQLPGRLDGDGPRPVARLADTYGTTMDFAEAELVVAADPGPQLDALLARFAGEIVVTQDFAAAGFPEIAAVHLIRIDPSTADPAGLPADSRATEPMAQGAHGVSSAAGMGTLAASLAASADGMVVGLNALSVGDGIAEEVTTEAANASVNAGSTPAAGQPYSTNAFDWAYMDDAHAQDIGIAEAWRRMEAAGVLFGNANSVPIGIIDDGFGRSDADRPNNSFGYGPAGLGPNAPGQFGERGILGCGPRRDAMGNIVVDAMGVPVNTCPWHGHAVSSAAAALVDNGRGAAGSGGPVASLVMVQRGGGLEGTIAALLTAADNGARIMNMSFSGTTPTSANATLAPLQGILNGLWLHHNRLFFASAGNNGNQTVVTMPTGADVDQVVCNAGGCVEPSTVWPCEFDVEVVCVGGVGAGVRTRAGGSNFGTSVDIFGPFTVFVGPDPDGPADQANTINGTSFSSPIVAGMAALLWTAYRSRPPFANPSNVEIYRTLTETASSSPDPQVTRILDAPAAINRALGAGSTGAPTVQLIAPAGDITLPYGTNRVFEATASDAEDGANCCTLRWTSDVDGTMSVARNFFYAFDSPGVRTVSVVATDSSATSSPPRTFRVDAVNDPPAVSVTRPAEGEGLRPREYVFNATISDGNEPQIDCARLTWAVGPAGDGTQTGCRPRFSLRGLSGAVPVTITGTDELGLQTVVTRNLTVTPIPPNSPPDIEIIDPLVGASYSSGATIMLRAEAELEEGEVSPVTGRWTYTTPRGTSEITTVTTSSTGTTTTSTGQFSCGNPNDFSTEQQTVTFAATDDDGTDQRSVVIMCSNSGT